MKLINAPFYPALCWAIKKYFPECNLPNKNTEIQRYDKEENNIDLMVAWDDTENGSDYWSELHTIFREKYCGKTIYDFVLDNDVNSEYYFSLMMEDYMKNSNPQLEFDL